MGYLDFGQIHKDLAAKLTDNDIRDILLRVNAVNRAKRLRLAGCVNITGAGLEPLRGSLVIEQIDLSLVGDDECLILRTEPPISYDHVLPILDSIIEQEKCAMKHLQFPNAWRREQSLDSDFHHFILRYNQMWTRRQEVLSCTNCSGRIPQRYDRDDGWVHNVGEQWISTQEYQYLDGEYQEVDWYGVQRYMCPKCLKYYCRDCDNPVICSGCCRMYCNDCSTAGLKICMDDDCGMRLSSCCIALKEKCRGCDEIFCDSHSSSPCHLCGLTHCESCFDLEHCFECDSDFCADCSPMLTCVQYGHTCEGQFCNGCAKDLFYSTELYCSDCGNFYCGHHMTSCYTCDGDGACCNDCRVKRTLKGGGGSSSKRKRSITCGECCQMLVPLLNERIEELTQRNNHLRGEIKSLRKSDQEGGRLR